MGNIEKAVKFMETIAKDDRHGYAQDNRGGNPDYDCSSFVGSALNQAGFNVNKLSTTQTLYSQLISCGFQSIDVNASRKRGDIFLTPGKHVVMCTDSNNVVHASLNEHNRATKGTPGDQTGKEIHTKKFYVPSYGWTYHLRYNDSPTTYTTIKGIDVSSYQKNINWKQVKGSGVKFAILRSTLKNNRPDSKFEEYYKGCVDNGIDVSVYKYSYALTEAQSIAEANSVISLLNGRKCKIWLDLEDKTQVPLGKAGIAKIAYAFIRTCENKGYSVGVYCNLTWFNNYIDDSLKVYSFWLARYGKNNGQIDDKYKPNVNEKIWQYSSKGAVPGIKGAVDVNVSYVPEIKNIVKVDTVLNVRNTPSGEVVDRLHNGTEVNILDYKDGWFRIGANKWVNADYIRNVYGTVTANTLNIRDGADTTYKDIGDLKKNEIVRIFEERNGWYKVLSESQTLGWVSGKYIDLI